MRELQLKELHAVSGGGLTSVALCGAGMVGAATSGGTNIWADVSTIGGCSAAIYENGQPIAEVVDSWIYWSIPDQPDPWADMPVMETVVVTADSSWDAFWDDLYNDVSSWWDEFWS